MTSVLVFTSEGEPSSPAALPWSSLKPSTNSFRTLSSPSKLKPGAYATHIETGQYPFSSVDVSDGQLG